MRDLWPRDRGLGAQLLVTPRAVAGRAAGWLRLATLNELGARALSRWGGLDRRHRVHHCGVLRGGSAPGVRQPWHRFPPAAVAGILGGALGTALVTMGTITVLPASSFTAPQVVHGSAAMARGILTVKAALASGEAMATFAEYCGVTLIAGAIQVATVMRNTSRDRRSLPCAGSSAIRPGRRGRRSVRSQPLRGPFSSPRGRAR